MVFTALIAAVASCNKKEVDPQVPADGYRYSFSVINDDTRALLESDGVVWEATDQVGMYLTGYTGYAKLDVTTTPKSVILYSKQAIPADSYAYAYYPYSGDNGADDKTATKIVLSKVQEGGANSAMPMVGIPFLVEAEVPLPEGENQHAETNGQIKFLNLGSIIDFKIYSADYADETVQYVQFQADTKVGETGTPVVSGDGYLDVTAVDASNESSLALVWGLGESYDYVKVDQETPVASAKADATSIYMVVAPGTYSGTITIGTDVATYTFPFTGKELARNVIKHYNMNLNNATRTEGVVEVVKTLPYTEAFTSGKGDFTIEGDTGNEWSFSANYGATVSGYYQAEGETGKKNHVANTSLVSPWIDLTDVTNAQITFQHNRNGYLEDSDVTLSIQKYGETAWTTLELALPTKPSKASSFSGWKDATVSLATFVGNKVKVKFNYVSTEDNAGTYEFKNFLAAKVKADAGLVYEVTEVSATIGEAFTAPELTNPNNLTVTYSSNNPNVASVNENTGVVELGETEGFATITAAFAGNDDFNEGSASYTIALTDPNSTSVFDKLNRATTGVEGTSYEEWSGKTVTSEAVYAGQSAGGNESIQLRSNSNNSGIVTTASGGTIKSVSVTWNSNTTSGRVLNVYGKNTAYTAATDLYNDSTAGVLIGTITCGTSTSLSVSDTYKYIGLRSASGAMYLTDVTIEWSTTAVVVTEYDVTVTPSDNGTVTANPAKAAAGSAIVLTVSPDENYILSNLTVDGEDVTASVSDNEYSFSMPAHNVTVEATFTPGQVETVTWVKTAYTDLATGDIVVIADAASKTAMSNNNGTSSAPSAKSVTISEDSATLTMTPDETLQWTVSVSSGSYSFGAGSNNLYCTNTNNGVRVGTNTNSAFTFEADTDGNPFLKNTATSRYVGVYNNQDWRCYTSINNNIASTRIVFYKKTTN